MKLSSQESVLLIVKCLIMIPLFFSSAQSLALTISTNDIGDLHNHGHTPVWAEIRERFDPNLGVLERVELKLEGVEIDLGPRIDFVDDGTDIYPSVGGTATITTEQYLTVTGSNDFAFHEFPETTFGASTFEFGCSEPTDVNGFGSCTFNDNLIANIGVVSGTVKMTPSGIRKLTPHFVNLHLTGGAYAEVGNIYGNTDIKQTG